MYWLWNNEAICIQIGSLYEILSCAILSATGFNLTGATESAVITCVTKRGRKYHLLFVIFLCCWKLLLRKEGRCISRQLGQQQCPLETQVELST